MGLRCASRLTVLTALATLALPLAAADAQEPKRFGSCGQLVKYARTNAVDVFRNFTAAVPFEGGGGRGFDQPQGVTTQEGTAAPAPQAGTDFSGTNVQEEGVDEPDPVKTDGRILYVATTQGTIHAIDVTGGAPRAVGRLATDAYAPTLFLRGRKLIAISEPGDAAAPGVRAIVREIDVSDPAAMRVLRIMQVEGGFLGARMVDGTIRAAFASEPQVTVPPPPPAGPPETSAQTRTRVRRALRRTSTRQWRPSYRLADRVARRKQWRPLVPCRQIHRTGEFSGLGMVTVLTIDADQGLPPVDSDAVFAQSDTVYASRDSFYLATQRWVDPRIGETDLPDSTSATTIHKLAATPGGQTDYRASGVVRGYLLSQWSLSEHNGDLRVASTDSPPWLNGNDEGPRSESFVTVLRELGPTLAPLGQVRGLGHGEEIYAVRFIGDRGYVVTFRQVDPLYTLDLSDPLNPSVAGELKILGYSAYLHPVGQGLLLGVGQDADERGRTRGTQLSLFDVSDPGAPRRLHQHAIGEGSWSEVEWDHHAFLYWPPTGTVVIPVTAQEDENAFFTGAVGFSVDAGAGIAPIGRIEHPTDRDSRAVTRSVVVGDRLYTVSGVGVKASTLGTFGDIGFAGFE